MNQNNGNHRSVAVVDAIEEDHSPDETANTFYDSGNPMLKSVKQTSTGKKAWRRKLILWCFLLLVMAGGAIGLYLLLKVNRVNVKVQADSRRDVQTAKGKTESSNSENGMTADAINIARTAAGADTERSGSPKSTATPTASPVLSPSPAIIVGRSLSFTGNSSPVNETSSNSGSNGNSNHETIISGNQQQRNAPELSGPAVPQARSNTTQSIFVEDSAPKTIAALLKDTPSKSRIETKAALVHPPALPPPVLPPCGTMLAIRTQGVIFTLRNNSYARLELTRDAAGPGWSLSKGTVLIGRTTGSEYDRAFVNVIGYIDPRDNKLVKLTGDVLGNDGGAGIPGKRVRVDRNRLKQTMRKVASSGVQVAGMMAGALGRGPVVVDGAGYRILNPITDETRGMIGAGNDKGTFVKVEAGRPAYVMVADLPKSVQAVDAPGEEELEHAATSLTDREVMELILFGSPEEIRAATPLMTDEQKRLTIKTFIPEND